jgi:hypothetical protein
MMVLLLSLLMAMPGQFQDKRHLLLFADNESNPQLEQQLKYLRQDANGLKDRDVEVKIYYKDKNPEPFTKRKIKAAFTAVLVGKDGGDKLTSTKPITLQKLYDTIDAMPMRRSEMKRHP